jgi:homoserine kinase
LPAELPHPDAAFTAGRAALLVRAFSGRLDLLLDATEDRIHQPYRLPGQPPAQALVRELRSAGVAAVLSGSGPSVLALATSAQQAQQAASLATEGFEAMPLPIDVDGVVEQPAT